MELSQRKFEDLSVEAQHVLDLIGRGWRLRVPQQAEEGRKTQSLVIDVNGPPGAWRRNASVVVAAEVVQELHAARVLWKLTEHRIDDRLGWREKGLDGDVADWYCLVI